MKDMGVGERKTLHRGSGLWCERRSNKVKQGAQYEGGRHS